MNKVVDLERPAPALVYLPDSLRHHEPWYSNSNHARIAIVDDAEEPRENLEPDAADERSRENVVTSRLLALPAELRLHILSYLLKGVHVHVSAEQEKTDAGYKTTTRIDVFPFDHPPPEYFQGTSAAMWRDMLNGKPATAPPCPSCARHEVQTFARSASPDVEKPPRQMEHPTSYPLPRLWRVCRQLHVDSLPILFSASNIFSFSARQSGFTQPKFHIRLPTAYADGVSRIWAESVADIRAHVDDLGVHGLRAPREIHAARNYPPPSGGSPSIYGISPLWLTDPFEIESSLLEQKRKLWEAGGTHLVFHDRP